MVKEVYYTKFNNGKSGEDFESWNGIHWFSSELEAEDYLIDFDYQWNHSDYVKSYNGIVSSRASISKLNKFELFSDKINN